MRRIFAVLIAAVSSLALVQVAVAADMPVKASVKAPVVAAPNWTGFYVGANVGGGWGTTNIDYVANDPGSTTFFRHGGTPNVSGDFWASSGR